MLMPLSVLPPLLFVVSLVLLAYAGWRAAPGVAHGVHVVLLAMALYIAENLTRMSRTSR
jgi:hypothetical protein